MKRSEINRIIGEGIEFLSSRRYPLPPQAFWSLEEWHENRDKVSELNQRRIGWDLTDFGSGEYEKTGLLLYTLSNGVISRAEKPVDQPYANKLLIVGDGQLTPLHHHRSKMEDIINLGGGNLRIRIYNVGEDDRVDDHSLFEILHNGLWETFAAGAEITLRPGERIRLDPHHYHEFRGESGQGKVLAEEVSSVNDDAVDNVFVEKLNRFPEITEDQAPEYLLGTELPGTEKFCRLVQKYLKAG
jgi:hypothetical protein